MTLHEFGRYEVLEEIARGAYGIVYRARDREMDRIVALKTLRAADAGPVARERFAREARLAARLDHPNIVKIFGTGEDEGRPFTAMALLEGAPLSGPLPATEACRVIARVARAVAHAHARGVVHRDLKPANIVVDPGGEPVLTDFGVARGPDELRLTGTGELLGTPAYMAPEQLRGNAKEAGPEVDVYALGAILFELLAGCLPFEGGTLVELSARVFNDPAPGLKGYDPALATLVRRCLSKDPASRPAAKELAEQLEEWAPRKALRGVLPASLLCLMAGAALWAGTAPPAEHGSGPMTRVPAGTYEIGDPRLERRDVALEEFWIDRDEAPTRPGGYSYLDAAVFCLRQGKRLPTEGEWEAAAAGCRDMGGGRAEWTDTPGRAGPDIRVVRGGHDQLPIEQRTFWERQEFPVTRRTPVLGFRCATSLAPEGY